MRKLNQDVHALRRCWDCYGKLDGKYAVEKSPSGLFARHADFGVCFRYMTARLRSLRSKGTRRARRRSRKAALK